MGLSPDAELVRRCRAGDEDAWRELVERFGRYVHAITVRGFGLHGVDAEDVFQDVFARVYERIGTLRDPDALRPWLAQTTRRCCVDRLRARQPEAVAEIEDEGAAGDVVAELDEALDVRLALATLSDDCAEILDRFFCRDESYRVISEALDLPAGTVASRISRCLTRLRTALAGEREGRNTVSDPSSG